MTKKLTSRRDFVKTSSLVAGGLFMAPGLASANYFSNADEIIKVALVGCGGRGTGAAVQALHANPNVQLVAVADAFRNQVDNCLKNINDVEDVVDRVKVPEENKFVGFDAYLKAIPLADVVLLATPPGFRPLHFEEAVKQGKHVFMEKPVAVDPAGINKVLAAAAIAKQKKLNVVVGLQRRYQTSYRELYKRKDQIGDILSSQVWWNSSGVWVRPRQYQQTEMEYQMRNWYYFNWLCGDHIVEQHVHNIDVANWFKGEFPVKAQGMGGREVRNGKEHGEIFDHFYVEFVYPDGTIMNSQCRHIPNTWSRVDELLVGTKGTIKCGAGTIADRNGKTLYQFNKQSENNPYQAELDELFAAIHKGEYKFDDAEFGAKSTMSGILGRMAVYSGQELEVSKLLANPLDLAPKKYDFNELPPVLPNVDGYYPVAVPGVTKYA